MFRCNLCDKMEIKHMRYYHCVNCGHYHDFKENRQRGLVCCMCGYDELSELDQEEWDETAIIRPWITLGKTYEEYSGERTIKNTNEDLNKKPQVIKRKRRTKAEMALLREE